MQKIEVAAVPQKESFSMGKCLTPQIPAQVLWFCRGGSDRLLWSTADEDSDEDGLELTGSGRHLVPAVAAQPSEDFNMESDDDDDDDEKDMAAVIVSRRQTLFFLNLVISTRPRPTCSDLCALYCAVLLCVLSIEYTAPLQSLNYSTALVGSALVCFELAQLLSIRRACGHRPKRRQCSKKGPPVKDLSPTSTTRCRRAVAAVSTRAIPTATCFPGMFLRECD